MRLILAVFSFLVVMSLEAFASTTTVSSEHYEEEGQQICSLTYSQGPTPIVEFTFASWSDDPTQFAAFFDATKTWWKETVDVENFSATMTFTLPSGYVYSAPATIEESNGRLFILMSSDVMTRIVEAKGWKLRVNNDEMMVVTDVDAVSEAKRFIACEGELQLNVKASKDAESSNKNGDNSNRDHSRSTSLSIAPENVHCSLQKARYKSGNFTVRFDKRQDCPNIEGSCGYMFSMGVVGPGIRVHGTTEIPNGFARPFYTLTLNQSGSDSGSSERVGPLYFISTSNLGEVLGTDGTVGLMDRAPPAVVLPDLSRELYYYQKSITDEYEIPPSDIFILSECK